LSSTNEKIISWLFETKAIRVCPQDKPFWYTSGTIGPYYINTHFLYGSEEKANKLLKLIDECKEDKLSCSAKILTATLQNYNEDSIYKGLIDSMCGYIKDNIKLAKIGCISGGERRDWFFSLIIAKMLDLPHVTIFKDLDSVLFYNGIASEAKGLDGKGVLHIADLITEASSYERAWIPAINNLKGVMRQSLVVVDRKQGGAELLNANGVKSHSMVEIGKGLFDTALNLGLIGKEQYEMIMGYIDNPHESMKAFLKNNPDFLEQALNSGDKSAERARLCVEKNIYGL